MSIRLDALVSAIAAEAGLDPDRVSQDKTNIVRWINDTRREIYELPVKFSALEYMGELAGVANVTAGTATVTQNLAEVTGSSTAFATAMSGRYISVGSGAWRRISYVTDTTHLTLEAGWPGTGSTASTYKIWKRDYALPPKVGRVIRFLDTTRQNDELNYFDPQEFNQRYGFGDTFGSPEAYTQFSQSSWEDAYLASTVFTSVGSTANSPILDFTSVGLVTAMAPGDRINFGNSTTSTAFYVDRILTDTKIALRQHVQITNSSLSATAFSLNRLNVRFYSAIDDTKVFYYEAYKNLYDILNNNDWLEQGWYSAVKKGSIAKAMGYVHDPREQQKLSEYSNEINNLIRNQYKAKNPSPRLRPYIRERYSSLRIESDRDV